MITELQMVSEMLADEMAERARERSEFDQTIDAIRNTPRPELDAILNALVTLTAEVRALQKPAEDKSLAVLTKIEKTLATSKPMKQTGEITFEIKKDQLGEIIQIVAKR